MATINPEMQSTASINIPTLNVIYDVTGMTATNKPGPNNATVFNVTIPTNYQYNGNFLFFLTASPNTPVSSVTLDSTTPGMLVVTCAQGSNLLASTDYTMSFDLKS